MDHFIKSKAVLERRTQHSHCAKATAVCISLVVQVLLHSSIGTGTRIWRTSPSMKQCLEIFISEQESVYLQLSLFAISNVYISILSGETTLIGELEGRKRVCVWLCSKHIVFMYKIISNNNGKK